MKKQHSKTAEGVIRSLIPENENLATTIDQTCGKIADMSFFLRGAFALLVTLFNIDAFLCSGKLFRDQSLERQKKQVERWKSSRLKVFQEFIGFYEKLAFFIYFSEAENDQL